MQPGYLNQSHVEGITKTVIAWARGNLWNFPALLTLNTHSYVENLVRKKLEQRAKSYPRKLISALVIDEIICELKVDLTKEAKGKKRRKRERSCKSRKSIFTGGEEDQKEGEVGEFYYLERQKD